MAGIDAAAVARISGVQVGTINVWIQRNLVPGMSVGTQGSAREFGVDAVLHIALMGVLGGLQFAAPLSAMITDYVLEQSADQRGARLVIGPPSRKLSSVPTFDTTTAEKLDAFLDDFGAAGRLEGYVVIELDRLAARVRKAFAEPDKAERAKRAYGERARQSARKSR
jgi:hypothetical protein